MGLIDLFQDFSVDYKTGGHKHTQEGWVNVPCPFCTGNPGYHLGYNIDENYFHCWRCGGKGIIKTLSIVLNIDYQKARSLAHKYKIFFGQNNQNNKVKLNKKQFKLPSNANSLNQNHINYLKKRGFTDINNLVKLWDIKGTGPISLLDDINFKHRLVYPIIWDGKIVSFQTRAIHEKSSIKYITCPKNREIIHHKDVIYRHPSIDNRIGIAVEGVLDVWKIGINAFCTFGIEFTNKQIKVIKNLYDKVYIMFDDDPQAKLQARKLKSNLSEWKVECEIIEIKGDPAEMSDNQVYNLLKNLKL